MKLLKYGERGAEHPGILDRDGRIRALGGHVSDFDAAALSPAVIERLKTLDVNALPTVPEGIRLGPCVARPLKFICIGLSQFMTSEPGDVISSGTPPGVGLGQKPPRYLEVGHGAARHCGFGRAAAGRDGSQPRSLTKYFSLPAFPRSPKFVKIGP